MDGKQLVQEILQKQGITRYRLAKDIGVEPSAVYRWLSGEKKPNGEHMLKLLRRAGKLAAAVLIGAVVSFPTGPGQAQASEVCCGASQSTVYYVKWRRRIHDLILFWTFNMIGLRVVR